MRGYLNMKYLELFLSDRIKGIYKTRLTGNILYLNKDFKIKKLSVNGKETAHKITKNDCWQSITFDEPGDVYLEYEGVLDGTSGLCPYVKEKTGDDFYILRYETLYYPLEYEVGSEEFISHYLYPQKEDFFKVNVRINDERKILSDLVYKEDGYYGPNPVFIIGHYHKTTAYFGNIYHLDLSDKIIDKGVALIKNANEILRVYHDVTLKDLNLYIMPEGYGSFVMNGEQVSLFITVDSFLDPHYLIHELTHLHWNPKCDPKIQNVRFFDEAISQYLTLKILDKLKIQSTKDTEKEYINTYRTYINEYGYTPSPILEYASKGNGDLSYSFGALALLAIEKRVGEVKMTSVLREIINSDTLVDFDVFKNKFINIEDIWHDFFISNDYSDKILVEGQE